jgi:hypothetical protein
MLAIHGVIFDITAKHSLLSSQFITRDTNNLRHMLLANVIMQQPTW